MKIKASLLLLLSAFFFISCGSATQDGEGSITLDAGKVARYLGRNAADSRSLHSVNARSAMAYVNADFPDINSYMYYDMSIKVSTIGNFETSAESSYKKSISEVFEADNIEATLESFYKEAAGKPITLEGIPVGSNIKVKFELSFGQSLDVDAYKQSLSAEVLNSINNELTSVQQELTNARYTVEAESETFTVKSGENTIKLTLTSPDGFGFESEFTTDIILYNKVSDPSNYKLSSYSPNILNGASVSPITTYYSDSEFVDFVITDNNQVFYAKRTDQYAGEIMYDTDEEPIAAISGDGFNITSFKMYFDNESQILFYASPINNAITINSYYNSNAFEYERAQYTYNITNIDKIFDFAVSLNLPPSTSTNADGQVTTYDGNLFMAAREKIQTGSYPDVFSYDIVITKIPLQYILTPSGGDVTASIQLNNNGASHIKLTDADISLPYDIYKYDEAIDINDMTVQDGKLYLLLSNKVADGDYYESTPDEIDFDIYSYGGLLSVPVSSFTANCISLKGYPANQVTNINYHISEEVQAQNSGKPSSLTFHVYQPNSTGAAYLFGPQKFIAIKPKKLIIADDGFYYYGEDEQLYYKDVDRIVVYDVITNKFQAYTLNTNSLIKFDNVTESSLSLDVHGTGAINGVATCSRGE